MHKARLFHRFLAFSAMSGGIQSQFEVTGLQRIQYERFNWQAIRLR